MEKYWQGIHTATAAIQYSSTGILYLIAMHSEENGFQKLLVLYPSLWCKGPSTYDVTTFLEIFDPSPLLSSILLYKLIE